MPSRCGKGAASRVADAVFAGLGILVLSPLFVVVALAVRLDSRGPVFYRQQRIGRHFRPFTLFKFRTMVHNADRIGRPLTVGNDPRITRVGKVLRKMKIDELPQLFNVVRGEMSLVGPRPEVPQFVELFRRDYEQILQVRPGITDIASVKYVDEADILARAHDPEAEYLGKVLPEKIRLAKEYLQRASLCYDAWLILRTVRSLLLRADNTNPAP